MSKKLILQSFLLILFFLIGAYVFFKYFEKDNLKVENKKTLNTQSVEKGNIIEDLRYFSIDKTGNQYEIKAKKGKIDNADPNNINMEKVSAIIHLENSEKIYINSDFAKYNTKSYDTFFKGSVTVKNDIHKLKSDYLDLSFEKNLVSIYENVFYMSNISQMKADRAEIDIMKRKTKIFMNNTNEKVLISNIEKNGNN
tara:strand:+ start:181 stop:771 length:591 start_codon:yes stop_codon:yes gene_type:complete